MGILSRFRDIMASNISALLDKSEDPEKAIDDFMRSVNSDLGNVKAEAAAMLAVQSRAKRALDECTAEIGKLQRYAEKSVENGDDENARKFLDKKVALAEKAAKLQAAYEAASANVASLKQIQDKLIGDIDRLEERRAKLKGKIAATKAQQSLNAINSSKDGKEAVFDAMEEKVNRAYDEAMAIAELRAEAKDDFDELFAQFEKSTRANAEAELAAIKEKMKKKE